MQRQLIGEVPGHDLDRALGAVIDRGVLVGRMCANRADVDDATVASALDHVPRGMLRQDEWRAKVDIDLLLPFAVTDLPEVAADAHAGIVDEDVQTGNEAERRLGQAMRLAYAREVA